MPREGQAQLLIWIDDEKKERFKHMTATLDTTMKDVIEPCIEEWMEENADRYREALLALAEPG